MLKRQRPLSPTHAAVPLLDCSIGDMLAERDSKRRRTLPPPLDGSYRGLADLPYDDDSPSSMSENKQDDVFLNIPTISDAAAEYKSANSVLRELHTLHHHRLLFFQSSAAVASSTCLSGHHPCHSMSSKTHLAPFPQYHDRDSSLPHLRTNQEKNDEREKLFPALEESCVKERYEGANRFLGSLVLSRRRDLVPSMHSS
ncbi:hypothetical protein BDQ17DRAFT_1418071 [Cyathus striatus]|nr:hypothetical protein BDQ17DRAFT_1418071 [Cyathus striatus]